VVAASERRRLQKLIKFEKEARAQGFSIVAGIDEAGRGPLAGPVVASACIIPEGIFFPGIDDSKVLTPEQREKLFAEITSCEGVIYAVGIVSHEDIDKLNIYQATIKAMLIAVESLSIIPNMLLVDGLKLPHPSIPCQKIIKGDALSQSIAAASVIAKVTRDRLMVEYDAQWPEYGFKKHKGYATSQHQEALELFGPCPIHRMSFEPCKPAPMYVQGVLIV